MQPAAANSHGGGAVLHCARHLKMTKQSTKIILKERNMEISPWGLVRSFGTVSGTCLAHDGTELGGAVLMVPARCSWGNYISGNPEI